MQDFAEIRIKCSVKNILSLNDQVKDNFYSSTTVICFGKANQIKIDNIKLNHALEINRIENKENLLDQEQILLAEKNRELESEVKMLMLSNDKLLTREKTLMKGMSGYCYELKVAVRTLQKDHKLQYKYDINYEYRSILEKVLINIYSEAERCSQVLSPRA